MYGLREGEGDYGILYSKDAGEVVFDESMSGVSGKVIQGPRKFESPEGAKSLKSYTRFVKS